MKAIRVQQFGAPEVMRVEATADPRPGSREVVVRIKAAGVNPVDTYIRAGTYARRPDLPYTPGTDAAGIVEEVGAEVGHIKNGDRVYVAGSLTGTYAERALCHESQLHPLPETISFPQGAGVGIPYGTAWHALFHRAHAIPGEFVLVHGASGGVGTAAVQIARAAGLQVIGTAGSERGRELAAAQGAYRVLDHHVPGYLDEIPRLTCGHGVDVVLEMLANVNLGKDLQILARGGRVVVIGSRGKVEIDPRDAMGSAAAILGMILFNVAEAENRSMHAALTAGLELGIYRPVVGREFPLAEALQAHTEIMTSDHHGKIVLIP